MKKVVLLLMLIAVLGFDRKEPEAFDAGEWFKFRIHYGIINAGFATLEVKEAVKNNKKVFHAIGRGYTTGVSKLFFKVEDNYESYFDKNTIQPYHFIRKIDEGGYIRNQEGIINHASNKVLLKDHKNKNEKTYSVPENIQDIVSTFYYLRNHPNVDKLNIGESIPVDMFFDDEILKFKLKYIGKEDIKTKFGVFSSKIFRPMVQSGRVFKEEESLTVWISNDENKIPLRIKADLAVGSLKADLDAFKGVKNPIIVKVAKND